MYLIGDDNVVLERAVVDRDIAVISGATVVDLIYTTANYDKIIKRSPNCYYVVTTGLEIAIGDKYIDGYFYHNGKLLNKYPRFASFVKKSHET